MFKCMKMYYFVFHKSKMLFFFCPVLTRWVVANLCWVDTWDEHRRRLGPDSCSGRASPRGRGLRPWSPVAPSPWEGRSCILGTHPPTHTQSNLQDEQLLGKEKGWLQIKLCINTFPTAVIAIFYYCRLVTHLCGALTPWLLSKPAAAFAKLGLI